MSDPLSADVAGSNVQPASAVPITAMPAFRMVFMSASNPANSTGPSATDKACVDPAPIEYRRPRRQRKLLADARSRFWCEHGLAAVPVPAMAGVIAFQAARDGLVEFQSVVVTQLLSHADVANCADVHACDTTNFDH